MHVAHSTLRPLSLHPVDGGITTPAVDSATVRAEYIARAITSLATGNSVDLSKLPRTERLEIINGVLAHHNLRPLKSILDGQSGQMEFTGIAKLAPDRFVARVDFITITKDPTKSFNHICFINANTLQQSGSIAVVIVNNEFVVTVSQGRPVIGESQSFELPRGFPDAGDYKASKMFGTFFREVKEETGLDLAGADATSIKNIGSLGKLFENTGTSNIANDTSLVEITLGEEQLTRLLAKGRTEDKGSSINVKLLPVAEALTILNDNHSLAALAKAYSVILGRKTAAAMGTHRN